MLVQDSRDEEYIGSCTEERVITTVVVMREGNFCLFRSNKRDVRGKCQNGVRSEVTSVSLGRLWTHNREVIFRRLPKGHGSYVPSVKTHKGNDK